VVAILPGDAGGRSDQGGEVFELEVLRLPWDSSPELRSSSVRSGRGGFHRSRPWEIEQVCQGGAQSQEERSSAERRAREGESLPKTSDLAGGSGGSTSFGLRSLVAEEV
jgi:hypothetical protein